MAVFWISCITYRMAGWLDPGMENHPKHWFTMPTAPTALCKYVVALLLLYTENFVYCYDDKLLEVIACS